MSRPTNQGRPFDLRLPSLSTLRRRPWPVRLLIGLAAPFWLAGALVVGPAVAPAQAAPDVVRIIITSVTPTILTAGDTVTITGTVTNLTAAPLGNARATLWTADQSFATVEELTDALAEPPRGLVVSAGEAAIRLTSGNGTIEAGASVGFTLVAPLTGEGSLNITTPGAAYLVGVRVTGANGSSSSVEFDRSLVVLTYPSPADPPRWVTVVELSAPPSLLRPASADEPAVFASDDLADQLTGALKDTLEQALQPGVTTILDPQLWDEAAAMADGYDVLGSDGETLTPGRGADAARAWLAAAADLLPKNGTYRGLYGSPDVARAAHAGVPAVLAQARAALSSGHPLAGLPLTVMPAGARCDDTTLAYLAPAEPSYVICGNDTSTSTITQAGPTRVLSLAQRPTTPAALSGTLIGRQSFTDAWLLLRSQARQPAALLLDGSAMAPPTLPLLALVPRGVTASGETAQFSGTAAPAEPPSEALLQQTTSIPDDVLLAGHLSGELAQATSTTARVIAGLWSADWPDDAAALAWADTIVAPIRAQTAGGSLQLLITSRWNLSTTDAVLPVTIVNDYQMTVNVYVRFASDNPQRLRIPASDVVTVEPGQSVQVRVLPQAAGNGLVPVTATLVTESGQPVGEPVTFDVIARTAGRLGWVIIVASGAAFLVATFLRVRQVRRQRAEAAAAE